MNGAEVDALVMFALRSGIGWEFDSRKIKDDCVSSLLPRRRHAPHAEKNN